MKQRGIAILGSTGSIGTQALEVIAQFPDLFRVEVLAARSSTEMLISQAIRFQPNAVVIADPSKWPIVKDALASHPIKVYCGEDALVQVVTMEGIDMVLTAMVGFSGLLPTLSAIEAGKAIALANKETLVVAGELVMSKAIEYKVPILPVDSEHSAIFQCLTGEENQPLDRIILTASGGPFRGKKAEDLEHIKPEQALAHPNWTMGPKITIDSATLMNKGLEVIEARWLFQLPPEKISVVVHPQSIIHSMVEFADGSIKAQMGLPDMKLPIQYALAYPHRLSNQFPRYRFNQPSELTFHEPDLDTFSNLRLAFESLRIGGSAPCVLNAANEIAVARFLHGEIGFLDIGRLNESVLEKSTLIKKPSLEEYLQIDQETRAFAQQWT